MEFYVDEVAMAQTIEGFYDTIKDGYAFENIDLADKNYDDIFAYVARQKADANQYYCLGFCYYYGLGVAADINIAKHFFEKAANLGHAHSQYKLASIYIERHEKENYDKALSLFKLAASQSYPPAYRILGALYVEGNVVKQDTVAGLEAFKKGAELGDTGCKFFAGLCYFRGQGAKQNDKEALKYFTAAADDNAADAQLFLALFYEHGDCGTKKDLQKAFDYNMKALQNGNYDACFNLYRFYSEGIFVKRDIDLAFNFLEKGAEAGSATSQYALANCYYAGIDVRKSNPNAFSWAYKAAKQNHPGAQFLLAELYLNKKEEYANKKALYWLKKAYKNGNDDAALKLGSLYEYGEGVEIDKKAAIRWYKKAVELGNVQAKYQLASLYIMDENASSRILKQALQLYTESANAGFSGSEFVLGLLFESGGLVEQDYEKAMYWFKRAKEHGEKNVDSQIKKLQKKMQQN